MPAYAEAKAALMARSPLVAKTVESALTSSGAAMRSGAAALTARGVYRHDQNVVRARAAARMKLHKDLSIASLMLATTPAQVR
jgi:hypothetical protein